MSSIREMGGKRSVPQSHNTAFAARNPPANNSSLNPNDRCLRCRHNHQNKDCFRLHPELAVGPKGDRWKANRVMALRNGSGNRAPETEERIEDSDEEDVVVAARAMSATSNEYVTIYDTGASHHFVPCKYFFMYLTTRSTPFQFDQVVVSSSLTTQSSAIVTIGDIKFKLQNALYSPKSSCIIISAGKLHRLGSSLVRRNNLHYIRPLSTDLIAQIPAPIAGPGIARVPKTSNAQRWHQRLGPTGQKILKKTAQCSKELEGIDISELTTCETCHLSKAQRYVSRELRPVPLDPLDEVFVDTIGKLTTALNGHQYAVIITDAKSRMRWAITTSSKDQIAPQLVKWIESQSHQFGKRVRTIFKDGGSEFFGARKYCDQHGIRTDISAPYIPEQNGTVESSNKVVLEKARSMLIDARMPAYFLQDLRQPHPETVDLSNLPRFGCRAYKLINPKPGKFDPRAEIGWFIGFQKNTNKNFLIYHPHWTAAQGWKWLESFTPHATFNEDVVFGDELNSTDGQSTTSYWAIHSSIFSEPSINANSHQLQPHDDFHESQPNPPSNPPNDARLFTYDQTSHTSPTPSIYHDFPSDTQSSNENSDLQVIPYPSPPEDQREITNIEEVSGNEESTDDEYDMVMTGWDPIRQVAGTKRPNSPENFGPDSPDVYTSTRGRQSKKVDYYKLHHGMIALTSTDPKTWEEAMTGPEASQWKKAANEEVRSLQDKGAIKIISLSEFPRNRKPMKCKWVFKKKFLANGDVDKSKARCTAKGFTQRQGIDYHETFAPTPRPETGRIMLVIAHHLRWHRRQGDVPTAFLNPNLDIDLFMDLPKGFEKVSRPLPWDVAWYQNVT
ncbi:hypothetical protein K3495_g13334 [Podosphaera aphanis]|nr:hypothetical protein K3495_g13334 [Podosphaera aphanis]